MFHLRNVIKVQWVTILSISGLYSHIQKILRIMIFMRHAAAPKNSTQLNSTQLYYDTFAAEQLNSWIAKYSSIT